MNSSTIARPGSVCPVAHGSGQPSVSAPTDTARADDGYFGPGSVSWRLFSDPSSKLGGVAAILLQALNPTMMRLFDATSLFARDMEGRSDRTAKYMDTTIFGDRIHADAAGEAVRRLHAASAWTDPLTGETLRADHTPWLIWTHNAIIWGVLRAADAFGPVLTVAEQDQFVREQHRAAEFVGIDPVGENLASTRAELDAYIDACTDTAALTLPAAEISRSLRKPALFGNPGKVWVGVVVQDAILSLLPGWARLLYGIDGRPMNLRGAARTTRRIISSARSKTSTDELISEITTRVTTHPYRKVRRR